MLDWYFLRGCGIINFSKDHSLMKQNEEINTFLPLDLALKYFAPLIEQFHTISSKNGTVYTLGCYLVVLKYSK